MGNVPPSLSAVAAAIAAANTKKHDGVRIKAPHYLEQHDEHRTWTSNKTWHFETGWVYHVTAGQVLHQNLNLAEIHTTSNLMTMHLDITPLNVHIGQKLAALDVHLEPSYLHKQYNYHGGSVHHVLNQFEQTAQEVKLTVKSKDIDFLHKLDLGHPAEHPGTMTLEADGVMSLKSEASIQLRGGQNDTLSKLDLSKDEGKAVLQSKTKTFVYSSTETVLAGGPPNREQGSAIVLKQGNLLLSSGEARVTLVNGNLTTTANDTKLNGKVTLGQPAVTLEAIALTAASTRWDVDRIVKLGLDELEQIKARLASLGG